MSCLINAGYTRGCDVAGGYKRLLFINYDDIDTLTITAGAVSAMTLKTSKKAYVYNVEQEVTTVSEKSIGSKENGSYGYEQKLTTKLHGNDATLNQLIDNLIKARIVVVAVGNDGERTILFHQFGAKAEAEYKNEAKFDGFVGYDISFTHRQTEKSATVPASITIPT
jgi:hypothetical protein